jgi:hypothetical protein
LPLVKVDRAFLRTLSRALALIEFAGFISVGAPLAYHTDACSRLCSNIMNSRLRSRSHVETDPMPVHDWTRVDAGIFHHFHHDWITEITRALNRGVLPDPFYALAEQYAGGFGPDVLTLQDGREASSETIPVFDGGVLLREIV